MRFIEFLQEYQEEAGGTITHDGIDYDLNKIFNYTDSLPISNFNLNYLDWMFDGEISKDDEDRVKTVNLSFPIIVTPWQNTFVIIDGWHRVLKALRNGITSLPAKIIFSDTLALCKI